MKVKELLVVCKCDHEYFDVREPKSMKWKYGLEKNEVLDRYGDFSIECIGAGEVENSHINAVINIELA